MLHVHEHMNTLPKTNIAPENRPSQKKLHFPTINSQGKNVSFKQGKCFVFGCFAYWPVCSLHRQMGDLRTEDATQLQKKKADWSEEGETPPPCVYSG